MAYDTEEVRRESESDSRGGRVPPAYHSSFFITFFYFKRFPSCPFVSSCIPLLLVEFPDTEAVYPDAKVVAVWHPAHQDILAGSAVHCRQGNAYFPASQDGINTSWLAAYTDGLVPLEAR